MSLPIVSPGVSAASIPAIEYYNKHNAMNESTYQVKSPCLPPNDIMDPPRVVRLTLMFRHIDDHKELVELSRASPMGIDRYIPITRAQLVRTISDASGVPKASVSAFYILRAQMDNSYIASDTPFSVGCVRFETRSRIPLGIRPIVGESNAVEWKNHILNNACMIDAAPRGGQIASMRGFWFNPGHRITADYFAPPLICSRLARTFASTVVHSNPFVKDLNGDVTYTNARDPRRCMNFKTQQFEQRTIDLDGTSDVYEFVDKVSQQISLQRREVATMSHVTSESTIAFMQSAWSRASEYTDTLQDLLVDCRPIDNDTEHCARLRICMFSPHTQTQLVADTAFTVCLHLDLLLFTS